MRAVRAGRLSPIVWLSLAFALLPGIVFYAILLRTAVNIPILDDYYIILDFVNTMIALPGAWARTVYTMTVQHNGYRLIFEHAVVWLQYLLLHRVHIESLVVFGNALVLIVFACVCCMFRPHAPIQERLFTVLPVCYLVFQLQYASALNFASSSLQHIAVLAFSLTCICLLGRQGQASFALACVAAAFAIAASPNGFFLLPVALFMLIQQKAWRRIATFAVVVAGILAVYLAHYHHDSVGPSRHPHFSPLYALSFLGAAAARFVSITPAVLLGGVLCVVWAVAVWCRYDKRNPAVFCSVLYILINAVAVSALRSDQGASQSLASRYRLYSALMLVFSYTFLLEEFVSHWKNIRMRRAFVVSCITFSMAFCLLSDVAGARFLRAKQIALVYFYRTQWQHQEVSAARLHAETATNPAFERQVTTGIYHVLSPIVQDSVRHNTWVPPQNP